jgi:hypothetical protein
MTVLVFNDRRWEVATSAWSAASKDGSSVDVCYTWGADGVSWFDSATGNARCTLDLLMSEFLERLARADGVLDLRS